MMKTPFQSTHSLRSATRFSYRGNRRHAVSIHALLAECDFELSGKFHQPAGFNPRTPCGVRLQESLDATPRRAVSIHALLAECDYGLTRMPIPGMKFQSTHSLRSATVFRMILLRNFLVSIHALLAECDLGFIRITATTNCFNPRTPCGVRPVSRQSMVRLT